MSKCKPSVQKIKASWRAVEREGRKWKYYCCQFTENVWMITQEMHIPGHLFLLITPSSFILLPLFRQIKHHDILFKGP